MALLIPLAALGAASMLAACSLVLDPDDLRARLADTAVTTTTDAAATDTTTTDTATTDTAATDTTATDTTATDTAALDTLDATPTSATDSDVTAPDTVEPEVVVRYSGDAPATCTLEYKEQTLSQCPVACPPNASWTVVVDASDSVGVGAFAWRFGATDGYGVSPSQASGPRVTLTITLPDCELLAGAPMGPGSIAVELATDGGAFVPYPALRWATKEVLAGSCTSEGYCPDP